MKKFDYKVVEVGKMGSEFELYLCDNGEHGWELVYINSKDMEDNTKTYVKMIFKREIIK